MQGVFNGNGERYKTKKALREDVEEEALVLLEATSFFGNEYDGAVSGAPDGTYTVVGPDPYTSRKWYATITVSRGYAKVA